MSRTLLFFLIDDSNPHIIICNDNNDMHDASAFVFGVSILDAEKDFFLISFAALGNPKRDPTCLLFSAIYIY